MYRYIFLKMERKLMFTILNLTINFPKPQNYLRLDVRLVYLVIHRMASSLHIK